MSLVSSSQKRTAFRMIAALGVLAAAGCVAGCNEEKKAEATAAPAPTPTPTPTPPPPVEPKEEPKPSRPEKIDTAVTPEHRAKAEAAVPDAKGFLDAESIETKLKANKALKDAKAAVAAFDKQASGKWLLFAGPIANLTPGGFDLGITYTPQIPGDMMGMSRQWFPVTFSDVKGYDQNQFKAGQMVVVLAKYGGKQKATPGNELVALNAW